MGTQNLWHYREQLFRIIEESLEVSLVICNADLSEFTVAKIFDVFNQVLPTGFVLSTGYWPFFNSLKKQSICVCGRYGMDCRHFKQDYHWINLDDVPADHTMLFSTRSGGLNLLNSDIELTPITGGAAGYILNIKLTFQYKKMERGRPRRKKDENFNINPDQLVHVVICSRYILQREYYPALHTIMFQPSPFFYETYGTCFPKLLQTRETLTQFPTEINQQFYTVSTENMPHFTLMLQYVNLPVHQYSKTLHHAVFAHLDPPKLKKSSYNKGTQTETGDSVEVWRYKELIGNLKPLWNVSKSSSCESLYVNPSANQDSFSTFVVSDVPSNTITDTIRNEMVGFDGVSSTVKIAPEENDGQELPTSTTQDKEYDAQWPQWGYQKVVAKKRGRKKCHSIQLFGHTGTDSRRRFNPLAADKTKTPKRTNSVIFPPMPSYATILKCPKKPQLTIPYNKELEQYKEDPDFQWFDNQFPDLLNAADIKKEKMDEEFDIAEEFIKQENEREYIRWRLKQIH